MVYGATAGPDPAIGVKRIYWSKEFAPGVPFSDGAAERIGHQVRQCAHGGAGICVVFALWERWRLLLHSVQVFLVTRHSW